MSCSGRLLVLRTRLLAVSLLAVVLVGCEDADEEPEAPAEREMQFNIDPALIGPSQRFDAFGVQFSPPAGWEALPAGDIADIAAALSGGHEAEPASDNATRPFLVEPLAVYGRPEEGLWLIVSAVHVSDPAHYTAVLSDRPGFATDDFLVDEIRVHQYRVLPDGMLNYKLLLTPPSHSGPARLQLDYLVPVKEYQRLGRTFESSIGSLRRTDSGGS